MAFFKFYFLSYASGIGTVIQAQTRMMGGHCRHLLHSLNVISISLLRPWGLMVITLIEYAIYLQPITAHNGGELDPRGLELNTWIHLTTKLCHFV